MLASFLVFAVFALAGVPAALYGATHLAQGGAAVLVLAFGWAFLTLAAAGAVAVLTRSGPLAESSSARQGTVTVELASGQLGRRDSLTGPGVEGRADASARIGSPLPSAILLLSSLLLLLTVVWSFGHHPAPVPALLALFVALAMAGQAARAWPSAQGLSSSPFSAL